MKKIKLQSKYKVGNGQIHLLVRIGEGQFGSSTVVVGEKVFDHVRLFDADIGAGSALAGKKIVIASVVTDTNEQTNRTDVTYRLSGGVTPWQQTSELGVDKDGDSVLYIAEIELEP